MDKIIGRKLDGRYEITELIGIGGMAEVYKAVDLLENRTVAVKILKNEYADNDDFVRRFRNESKAIAVLSHPNIVKIYDVGFSDKIQFIVMEYIDGITLKEFMEQQGALKWKDSVHFITQILRALQHAHDRGIVHRDIKPQNIMLFPDGTIKVMDFGIARFAREEGKTMSDKAIGSVHYISPEQARGDITDEKSDIYSVGVMLYEMLTGVKPFDGDTPIAVALMHMQTTPRRPKRINDSIPDGLDEIVMRAMQKDASKRYQSASEMIKDIEDFKRDPSMVFEYDLPAAENESEEKTQYFDKPSDEKEADRKPRHMSEDDKPRKRRKPEPEYEEYDDDDDDDDDEEEEVSKSSYFVVALTAIAAAVIIIVAVFIAIVVAKEFTNGGTTQTQPMVDLVGRDFNEMRSRYEDSFSLVVEKEEYNPDFPAGTIISHSPKKDSPIMVGNSEVRAVVSKGARMVNVPNTYTIEANTATSMIEGQGLKYSLVMQNSDEEANHVIKTDPERNTLVEVGSTVLVYVSLGPEEYDIVMPDVVGMELVESVQLLEGKGFTVVSEKEDSVAPANEVTAQSIPPTDEEGEPNIVNPKQTVIITYSSGEVPTTTQNITFTVPEGLDGPAVFNAYVGGNLSGTTTIDNIGYVATINIPVKGQEIQKVVVETVTEDGHAHKVAEYNVDFNTGAITETEFDSDLLRTLYPAQAATTSETEELIEIIPDVPFETDFVDPADIINPGGGFWDNIGGN